MSLASQSLVTVGLPVRNGGGLISTALQGLLNQTYGELEILVSDNASNDDTALILQAFADQDTRVRVQTLRDPVPAFENFTRLLEEAQGEYFMWAAHDDLRNESFIECLVEALETHQGAVLAFGNVALTSERGQAVSPAHFDFATDGLGTVTRLMKTSHRQCFHFYGLWRTEELRKIELHHASWWTDLPVMVAASTLGDFVHVNGADFTYLETVKTSHERARAQDYSDRFSYTSGVASLLRATYLSTRSVAGPSLALGAVCFVALKQLERLPGFVLRRSVMTARRFGGFSRRLAACRRRSKLDRFDGEK